MKYIRILAIAALAVACIPHPAPAQDQFASSALKRVQNAGSNLPREQILNFTGSITAADDPTNHRTNVSFTDASVHIAGIENVTGAKTFTTKLASTTETDLAGVTITDDVLQFSNAADVSISPAAQTTMVPGVALTVKGGRGWPSDGISPGTNGNDGIFQGGTGGDGSAALGGGTPGAGRFRGGKASAANGGPGGPSGWAYLVTQDASGTGNNNSGSIGIDTGVHTGAGTNGDIEICGVNCSALPLGHDGVAPSMFGAQIGGPTASRPTCNSGHELELWINAGGGGVTDTVYACLKSAANTYNWISIITGG